MQLHQALKPISQYKLKYFHEHRTLPDVENLKFKLYLTSIRKMYNFKLRRIVRKKKKEEKKDSSI